MNQIIYAIKIAELSYSGLKILNIKIGRTTNPKATLQQYKRTSHEAQILDLWESNPDKSLAECENGIHKIAEKYAYERKGETFIFLQGSYKEFSENVNLILKNVSPEVEKIKKKFARKTSKIPDYTGKEPELIKFQNKSYKVNTWRDVLHIIAKQIYQEQKDFAIILNIKGTRRNYFSKNSKDLVDPQKINGTPYFFEGNLSTNQIIRVIQKLLNTFGYKLSDFVIEKYE